MTSKVKSFRAEEALLDKLHAESDRRGVSQNALICEALDQYLNPPKWVKTTEAFEPVIQAPAGKPLVTQDGNSIHIPLTKVDKELAGWKRR